MSVGKELLQGGGSVRSTGGMRPRARARTERAYRARRRRSAARRGARSPRARPARARGRRHRPSRGLLQNEEPRRPCERLEHGRPIERPDRAQVEYLDVEVARGAEREVDTRPVGDDRRVGSDPGHTGTPDRDAVVRLRQLAAEPPVEPLVLEEEDRVVVLDRGPQEAVGVGDGSGADDLEPRDADEPALRDPEWNGPPRTPPPDGALITSGTRIPERQCVFAATLTI